MEKITFLVLFCKKYSIYSDLCDLGLASQTPSKGKFFQFNLLKMNDFGTNIKK